ncbi:suppressor of hpr1 [Gurleya vavrai]
MTNNRFERELEFIQTLCNPEYLQFLYQNDYFANKEFIDFLKYLRYWQTEPYRNFLLYSQCLEILELCLDEEYVKSFCDENTFLLLGQQLFCMWNNKK